MIPVIGTFSSIDVRDFEQIPISSFFFRLFRVRLYHLFGNGVFFPSFQNRREDDMKVELDDNFDATSDKWTFLRKMILII